MSLGTIGVLILWALVFIYAMTGSIDFGAGFWAMVYMREKDAQAAIVANRYLSPLWEVTNVFLVLFAVALVGLFPEAAYVYGSLLLVPGSLILILLSLRTVMLVYVHVVNRFRLALRVMSGITGILIPALLVTVLPLSEGGMASRIGDKWLLDFRVLFGSWTVYLFMLLAIISELFVSAVFLSDYARISGDDHAHSQYRKNALRVGPLVFLAALLIPLTMRANDRWLQVGLATQSPWFITSGVLFLAAMYLLAAANRARKGRVRLAAIAVTFQYLFAIWAYGRAHYPYLLYPELTVHNSFTDPTMFKNAMIVLIAGIAILFPGFVWFWRLFLSRRAFFQSGT